MIGDHEMQVERTSLYLYKIFDTVILVTIIFVCFRNAMHISIGMFTGAIEKTLYFYAECLCGLITYHMNL